MKTAHSLPGRKFQGAGLRKETLTVSDPAFQMQRKGFLRGLCRLRSPAGLFGSTQGQWIISWWLRMAVPKLAQQVG